MIAGDYKEITCVLPRGEGLKLLETLSREKDITSTAVGTGRGFSERNDVIREVDLVQILVAGARANEIFEFIYHELGVGEQRERLIFQSSLQGANNPCHHHTPPETRDADHEPDSRRGGARGGT